MVVLLFFHVELSSSSKLFLPLVVPLLNSKMCITNSEKKKESVVEKYLEGLAQELYMVVSSSILLYALCLKVILGQEL